MTFIDSIRRTVGRGPRGVSDETPQAGATTAAGGTAVVASETSSAAFDAQAAAPANGTETGPAIEIAPSDPLFAYLQSASGVVDAERLDLESTALAQLRGAGVRVIVPLVTQGELIGALYLGPRLSDQDYSTDDHKLLSTLAAQAAPAIRVAQLVREQASRSRPGSAWSRRCGSPP